MSLRVLFLGPCYKINRRTGVVHEPFAPESRSGRFLRATFDDGGFDLSFANVIPGPVLDRQGCERNPTAGELVAHIATSPLLVACAFDVVVGLSGPVRQAFEISSGRRFQPLTATRYGTLSLLFADHPSYVMRRPATERALWTVQLRAAIIGAARMGGSPASSAPRVLSAQPRRSGPSRRGEQHASHP